MILNHFIFTILVSLFFLEANSQERMIDLSVTLVDPTPSSLLISPGIDTVSYYIVNNGVDSIYPTDGYMTRIRIDYRIVNPIINYVGDYIPPGDSLMFSHIINLDNNHDRESIKFCVTTMVYASDRRPIKKEQDVPELYEDNQYCTTMSHKRIETTSTVDLAEKWIRVYPNPAHHVIRMESKEEILKYTLTNVQGTVAERKGDLNQKHINLDVSEHVHRLYFLTIYTISGNVTKKILIHH